MVALLKTRTALSLVMTSALLVGCQVVPPSAPTPPPPPPAPPPPPPPAAPEPALSWEVAPVTEGNWTYSAGGNGSTASFGAAGMPALVSIGCTPATRQIVIALGASPRTAPVPVTIRTSGGTLNWPSATAAQGRAITRPASDPGFDWIVYSRGRFSIETGVEPRLIVPVGGEIGHVVEDCRG